MEDMLSDIKTSFDLFKAAIDLFRSSKDLLPNSAEKLTAEKSIDEAEKIAKIAEAKLAQAFGFQVCPKEWPPVIMLATEVHGNVDLYQCPSCGTRYANHGKRNNRVNLREYVLEKDILLQEPHE